MADANSVEQVVYEYLTTDSAFMANFSKVYWQEADAIVDPYIVFWMVDDIGAEERLNRLHQGEARIQFDLWVKDKIKGAKLRTVVRKKVAALNETRSGYHVMTTGINEQTIIRQSGTEPYHYVVDGIIKWNEE